MSQVKIVIQNTDTILVAIEVATGEADIKVDKVMATGAAGIAGSLNCSVTGGR
ncbi:MAG: hypothetical protein Q8R88_10700 [Desulfoprunum sp.]|nr:hypothetical protein [Desulfoprunum sp.]